MYEQIIWIIVLNLVLYFHTLRFKLVSDDFSVYHNPPKYKNKWHKAWLRFTGQGKWSSPSYAFMRDHRTGKMGIKKLDTAEFEHLLALVIHIAICVSIFIAFGSNHVSFIAALLYSTNPVNNQSTIWPGGRGYALPILSLLLAIAIPLASPIFLYFCSWYTIGFLAPLVLVGSPWWYLLISMPIIWFIHGRKYTTAIKLKAKFESYDNDKRFDYTKIVVYIKTFGFYFAYCLLPFRVTFYHNFLQSMAGSMYKKCVSIKDKYFWIGLSAMIGITWYSITNWNLTAWALVAFWIGITPFCNIIRANQEIADRFCGLPNVFMMFALATLIYPYPVLCAIFITFYATRAYYTVKMYRDEYWITEIAVIEDEDAWWAWHCRAMKRWDNQSFREALIFWTIAKTISPKEFKLYVNLATAIKVLGNAKEADTYIEKAALNIVPGQEKEAAEVIKNYKEGKLPILL